MTRQAVLVAHGFPSDPDPQEKVMQALAARVCEALPGWQVRGATLAAEGALDCALDGFDAPLIYPFFMAAGWFAGTELPRRLAGRGGAQLPPFGLSPLLPAIVQDMLSGAAVAQGWRTADTGVLLAAHGSQRSSTSSDSTHAMVAGLQALGLWREVRCGFVEEAPFLVDAAQDMGQAICLPFFALRAGHVVEDIPAAMSEAGFVGPVLHPLGEANAVPGLIAADLLAAQ